MLTSLPPFLPPSQYYRKRVRHSLHLNHGRLYLEGLALTAGAVTLNQRIYRKDTLVPALARYLKTRTPGVRRNWDPRRQSPAGRPFLSGELEHPSYADRARYCSVLHPSHHVRVLRWEGSDLRVVVEVDLSTPAGQHVLARCKAGMPVGISVRTWASLERRSDGTFLVADDLQILTLDLVGEPSVPGAFLLPVTSTIILQNKKASWAHYKRRVTGHYQDDDEHEDHDHDHDVDADHDADHTGGVGENDRIDPNSWRQQQKQGEGPPIFGGRGETRGRADLDTNVDVDMDVDVETSRRRLPAEEELDRRYPHAAARDARMPIRAVKRRSSERERPSERASDEHARAPRPSLPDLTQPSPTPGDLTGLEDRARDREWDPYTTSLYQHQQYQYQYQYPSRGNRELEEAMVAPSYLPPPPPMLPPPPPPVLPPPPPAPTLSTSLPPHLLAHTA